MKLVSVISLLFAACVFAADYETEENVIVLTDDNFDAVVSSKDILLVEFYAPWCGHCKKLAPEYAEAATELLALDEPLYIAKLDATAHKEAAGQFGIQGFPTLKLFRGLDSVTDYDGGRTASAIVQYMKKKSGPSAKTLASDEITDFQDSESVTVVGYFKDESSDEYKTFMKVADAGDLPFGVIVGSASDSIVLNKKGDEKVTLSDDLSDKAAIEKFIGANRLPLLIPFNPDTAKVLFGDTQTIRVQVLTFAFADKLNEIEATVLEAASEYKGKALFVHVDETNDRVFEYFGLTQEDFPAYVVVNMPADGAMKKFSPDSNKDISGLKAFVAEYFAGNLKPALKSAEIPESQDEAVYVLVGKQFNEIAFDDSKDVLVEFYAPWCGHCKALAPKYDELAEKFADNDNVVIAKMDATENEVDHEDINVTGFPTLKFFPANSNGKVMDYDSARETDAMYEFVVKNGKAEPAAASGKDEL